MTNKRFVKSRVSQGSALILTVVLTSLLAIVGVLFVLVARLDKIATSAISENKELNLAVETVVAKISQELAMDIPGAADANEEYYDYPDLTNIWLACLEPYQSGSNYYWRRISDIYGVLDADDLQADIVPDYQEPAGMVEGLIADADGDGIADSKWIELDDITTNKGKPIFAAVRIVDNGGMINVNTAYEFDPCEPLNRIDGSSQLQINLMALAGRPPLPSWPVGTPYTSGEEDLLLSERDRYGIGAGLNDYENFVIWSYGELAKPYTPFDISDELELRYRFLLNHEDIDTRLEPWGGEFRSTILSTPVTSGLDTWFKRAHFDPNILDMKDSKDPNYYAYRHIATTCNMDRVINPLGLGFNYGKMANVNRVIGSNPTDVQNLYSAIYAGLYDANFAGNCVEKAAQIAVNLVDYRDADDTVTVYTKDSTNYYGFERPCIYISELAHNFTVSGDPPTVYRSYAVELYKPYSEDNSPVGWRLIAGGTTIDINNPDWSSLKQFYVIRNENINAPLGSISTSNADIKDTSTLTFTGGITTINLQRPVPGGYITVDSVQIPSASGSWLQEDGKIYSIRRDINEHKCIRRLCSEPGEGANLGALNNYTHPSGEQIQAHPYLDPSIYGNQGFKNIGEIGTILRKSAYSQGPNPIEPNDTEATARLDLSNSVFQQIFNYLTVFPPAEYVPDPNETRIKGRININTAPWFVLAQLPWITNPTLQPDDPNRYKLARSIVAYRDEVKIPKGFESIGELINVAGMDYYATDPTPSGFPDLTPNDDVGNDFEERDVIFARISNLVTVRSDVFTAYILVRIGEDGPQKRMMAILDRSNVYSPDDKVKVVALHPVPDPR